MYLRSNAIIILSNAHSDLAVVLYLKMRLNLAIRICPVLCNYGTTAKKEATNALVRY